jgi:hypothetical protein
MHDDRWLGHDIHWWRGWAVRSIGRGIYEVLNADRRGSFCKVCSHFEEMRLENDFFAESQSQNDRWV